jgi:uncharacterized membrane protein
MEELNYILNNHTEVIFYLILAIVFGSVLVRFLWKRLQRKNRGRRFDDR